MVLMLKACFKDFFYVKLNVIKIIVTQILVYLIYMYVHHSV